MNKINIGYFSDGLWASNTLSLLIQDQRFLIKFICGLYYSLDKTLESFAFENKIDFIRHLSVNSDDFLAKVKKYSCDIIVSMSFNQILKNKFINHIPLQTIKNRYIFNLVRAICKPRPMAITYLNNMKIEA